MTNPSARAKSWMELTRHSGLSDTIVNKIKEHYLDGKDRVEINKNYTTEYDRLVLKNEYHFSVHEVNDKLKFLI